MAGSTSHSHTPGWRGSARLTTMLGRSRLFPNGEWRLILAVLAEIALFAVVAPNFLTVGNFFEVSRLSVEVWVF